MIKGVKPKASICGVLEPFLRYYHVVTGIGVTVMDGDVIDGIFPWSYCYYVAWVLLCLSLGLSVATGIRNLTTVIVYFTGIDTMLTYSVINVTLLKHRVELIKIEIMTWTISRITDFLKVKLFLPNLALFLDHPLTWNFHRKSDYC